MPTPYFAEYLTVGSLMGGSLAIHCFDWFELVGAADKRGDDPVQQGQSGRIFRTRVEDEDVCRTRWELDCRYDQDNQPVAENLQRANLYSLLAVVRATVKVNTLQTVTLTYPGGPAAADCVVDSGFKPKPKPGQPFILTFDLTLTLPGGSLL